MGWWWVWVRVNKVGVGQGRGQRCDGVLVGDVGLCCMSLSPLAIMINISNYDKQLSIIAAVRSNLGCFVTTVMHVTTRPLQPIKLFIQ